MATTSATDPSKKKNPHIKTFIVPLKEVLVLVNKNIN